MALVGSLDVWAVASVRRELIARLSSARLTSLDIDASGIERGDMSGMAILYGLMQGRFGRGMRARLVGLRPELQKLLSAFPSEATLKAVEAAPPRASLPEEIGTATLHLARDVREQVAFVGDVILSVAAAWRPRGMRWAEVLRVFEKAGVNALPIVSLISVLTGMVIAFEAADPFARYGAQIVIVNLIGTLMTRELGPLLTAVVVAGRSGSAFAAELGTMKVNEELDALETLGLDPMRFLVIQRVLAAIVLTPLLTIYSMALGVGGGATVMVTTMGFAPTTIWNQLLASIRYSDLLVGISKGVVFGATVAGLGCQRGMQTGHGPSAVGDAATRAVVAAIVMIVVIDSVFAGLTYVLQV